MWAHMLKAGGDATLAMFEAIPRLIVYADPPNSTARHILFAERETALAGNSVLLNIRRPQDAAAY